MLCMHLIANVEHTSNLKVSTQIEACIWFDYKLEQVACHLYKRWHLVLPIDVSIFSCPKCNNIMLYYFQLHASSESVTNVIYKNLHWEQFCYQYTRSCESINLQFFNKKQRMGWKICMINSYICVYEWTGVLKVQSGGHFVRYPRSALSSCKYRRHASKQIKAGGWGSTNTMQLLHHSSYLGEFLHMHLSSVELKAMRTWEWAAAQ